MAWFLQFTLAAHVAATCPDDCSLNGFCNTDGTCSCDAPWRGESCAEIEVLPAQPGSMYGYYSSPNVSSWGGNAVRDDAGRYHLFVAEMAMGGLSGWAKESQCTHALASTAQGPFEKSGVAIGKWCHNPYALRHPVTGEYLLFHIGHGPLEDSSDFLHHAQSPFGPWLPAPTKPTSCNNPAPAFHPNGTLFVICNHMQITRASADPLDPHNTWSSLRRMARLPANGTIDEARNWEDPSLWFDSRGHWHVLYHVYCLLPYSRKHECASGHAFSRDGLEWTFSNRQPYSGTVTFTDGSAPITFSTRERPHVVFAQHDLDRTTPVGVTTAVSPQQPSPECDTCRQNACSQCKVTPGRDWTYTQFQPFAGFSLADYF